ncbi:RING finger domain and kelch repeat-containing protein, partial [Biomphalaria glabrata]
DNCYVHNGLSSLPRVLSLESIISKQKQTNRKGASLNGIDACAEQKLKHESDSARSNQDFPLESKRAEAERETQSPLWTTCDPPTTCSAQLTYVLTLLQQSSADIPVSLSCSGHVSTLVQSSVSLYLNNQSETGSQSRLSRSSLTMSDSLTPNPHFYPLFDSSINLPSRPITKFDLLLPIYKLLPLTASSGYEHVVKGDTSSDADKCLLHSLVTCSYSKSSAASCDNLDCAASLLTPKSTNKITREDNIHFQEEESELILPPSWISSQSRKSSLVDTEPNSLGSECQMAVQCLAKYNKVPKKPVLDLHMSSRSSDCVVLALAPPTVGDVIDGYEVVFGTWEQVQLNMEETVRARLSDSVNEAYCFIPIENLCQSTRYFFSVTAVNQEGHSPSSDSVHCRTLDPQDIHLQVPIILEIQSHTSSRSATVITSQRMQHQREMTKLFLLHRKEADVGTSFAWSGTRIERERCRHEVDYLQPDTEYQFIVMVVGEGGRCQLSEKLWLKTSAS